MNNVDKQFEKKLPIFAKFCSNYSFKEHTLKSFNAGSHSHRIVAAHDISLITPIS